MVDETRGQTRTILNVPVPCNNIDLLITLGYDFHAAVTLFERWLNQYQAQQAKKKTPTPPRS